MTARTVDVRRWAGVPLGALLFAVVAAPRPLDAQSLADRIAHVRDGKVRMSYATRPDVCGNGHNIQITRSNDDWESDCEHGPARVQLEWRQGELVDVDTYVGGRWRPGGEDVTDLGVVSPADAAHYLLGLARRTASSASDDVIFPATIADSVTVWPELLEIARDGSAGQKVRKSAIFWLGQAAGEAAAESLGDIVDSEGEDVEVKESAVFALSQLHGGAGVPALLEIARANPSSKVRRSAMFWLSQSNDPRAVALFEEILTGH